MIRPIIQRPFNAVIAPSNSRPQLSIADLRADLLQAKRLMGASGVAGFTEISYPGSKQLFLSVFGHQVGVRRSDCPVVWTEDFIKVAGGVDFGAPGIPVVAPARKTSWVNLRHSQSGLKVGVISTHMHPGGFVQHPRGAQRLYRPLIQRLWRQHYHRITRRIDLLIAAGCDIVVVMGDINHPGFVTWPHVTRATGPGLLYLGVTKTRATVQVTEHRQNADHSAGAATITL